MTSPIGYEGVGVSFNVMTSSKVMTKLMTKSIVANCTTFLADGQGNASLVGSYEMLYKLK